jgi:hypothetical protein
MRSPVLCSADDVTRGSCFFFEMAGKSSLSSTGACPKDPGWPGMLPSRSRMATRRIGLDKGYGCGILRRKAAAAATAGSAPVGSEDPSMPTMHGGSFSNPSLRPRRLIRFRRAIFPSAASRQGEIFLCRCRRRQLPVALYCTPSPPSLLLLLLSAASPRRLAG